MIFLTSLIFALLLYVIPGQLAVGFLAHTISPSFEWPALLALDAAIYGAIYCALRFTHFAYHDFGWDRGNVNDRLREFLDVRGARWLNFIAIVGISLAAWRLFESGRLPFAFWPLYAATLIGLFDLFGKDTLIPLPIDLPEPVFTFPPEIPETLDGTKTVEIAWKPANRGEPLKHSFIVCNAEYEAARAVPRHVTRPLTNYGRYTHEHFGASLERAVRYFREHTLKTAATQAEEMMTVVNWTRAIPYKSDTETHGVPEYGNFAIETLYETAGDCEDHAILAAAVLRRLGHDAALFWLDMKDSAHLALAWHNPESSGPFTCIAANGRCYSYVETVPTSDDEQIGDICDQFLTAVAASEIILIEER